MYLYYFKIPHVQLTSFFVAVFGLPSIYFFNFSLLFTINPIAFEIVNEFLKQPVKPNKGLYAINFQKLLSCFDFARRRHLFYWPQKIILQAAKIFFTRRKNLLLRRVKFDPFTARKTTESEPP